MIALKVSLNGKKVCTAGTEDLGVLNAIVTAVGPLGNKAAPKRDDESVNLFYMVGGLTSRQDPATNVHVRWKSVNPLKIGDEITIKIVSASTCDRPRSRKRVS